MKTIARILAVLGASALAGPGHSADWKPLHNGVDWTGWDIHIKGHGDNEDPRGFFSITEEGWIHTYRDTPESEKVTYGVFQTEKAYSHYRLRFQYKWGKKRFAPRKKKKRDAGLLFHCYTDDRKQWTPGGFPLSVECQVQEGDTGDLWLVQARANIPLAPGKNQKAAKFLPEAAGGVSEQRTGGRVLKNPASDHLEGWNDVEVEILGSRRARYWVNGVLVMELEDMKRPAMVNGKPDRSQWVPLGEGKLAFQCEASEVFYRNIEILELPEDVEPDPDLPLSPLVEKESASADAAIPAPWKAIAKTFPLAREHRSIRLLDAVPTFLEHDEVSPGPQEERSYLHFTTTAGEIASRPQRGDFHLRGVFKWGWRNAREPRARRAAIRLESDGARQEPVSVSLQEGRIGQVTGADQDRGSDPAAPGGGDGSRRNAQGFWRPGRAEHPPGEWNQLDLVRKGGSLAVHLNGKKISDAALSADAAFRLALVNRGSEMWWRSLSLTNPRQISPESLWTKDDTLPGRNYPLPPEESIEKIRLDGPFAIQLVAAEPLVTDPVDVAFADDGSLYVVEMRDYPLPDVGGESLSRIKRLFDDDGDGRMDRSEIWADRIPFPNGIAPYQDGFVVTARQKLLFLADRDGDGQVEHRETWMTYPAPRQSQLDISSPRWRLDGRLHLNNGLSGSEVTTTEGAKETVAIRSRNLAYDPLTAAVETMPGVGQYGASFDAWGRHYSCSNRNPAIGAGFSLRAAERATLPFDLPDVKIDVAPAQSEARVVPLFASRQTDQSSGYHSAACGLAVYGGAALPELRGDLFVCDPTGPVVTRSKLLPDGPAMKAERIRSDGTREFLQTSDIWTRPVNLRNAPDGALYLVDMYRQYIDHSKFWKIDFQSENNMRAGADRGRIYRIVPKGAGGTAGIIISDLAETVSQLVAALANDNIWERRRAHRLLIERADPASRKALLALAVEGVPMARAHALWILDRLGWITEPVLAAALQTDHTELLGQGIEIAARHLEAFPGLVERLSGLTAPKQGIRVRYPAMLALAATGPRAYEYIDLRSLDHPYLTAAVATSLDEKSGLDCLRSLASRHHESGEGVGELLSFLRNLAETLGKRDRGARLDLIATLETEPELRDELLGAYLTGAIRKDASAYRKHLAAADPGTRGVVAELIDRARAAASDPDEKAEPRVSAMVLLKEGNPSTWEKTFATILERKDDPLRPEAVKLHLSPAKPAAAGTVLDQWSALDGPSRNQAAGQFFTNRSALLLLIDRIEAGEIDPASLSRFHRRRMRSHRDEEIAKRARKHVPLDPHGAARARTVEEYREAVPKLAGDPISGQQKFAALCATCHRAHGIGLDFGPGLTDLGGDDPTKLVQSILQPSAEVEDRWAMVTAKRKDGSLVAGLLEENSPSVLELKLPGGEAVSIDKSEVASIDYSDRSMMPEGLEATLGHQGMADLLMFLKEGPSNEEH